MCDCVINDEFVKFESIKCDYVIMLLKWCNLDQLWVCIDYRSLTTWLMTLNVVLLLNQYPVRVNWRWPVTGVS